MTQFFPNVNIAYKIEFKKEIIKMKSQIPKETKISICIAELTDLPAIVGIYNQAVPTYQSTANTELVTVEDRKKWFLEHERDKHPIFVAKIGGIIVGWASLSVYRPGRFALRFTKEISFYVDSDYQRQGVGSALLRHIIRVCPSLNIKNIVAVVIDQNIASKSLLENFDFQQWGYLPCVLDFSGNELGEFYLGLRIMN